jgi:hypothetical protein
MIKSEKAALPRGHGGRRIIASPTGERTMSDPLAMLSGSLLLIGRFGGNDEEFAIWLRQLQADLAPTSAVETLFVELILNAAVRLRRAAKWEADAPPGDPAMLRY